MWREIQCAVSINLEDETVDWERDRLRVDSKDLCGALVSIQTDGTVVLVHHSAKRLVPVAELCMLIVSNKRVSLTALNALNGAGIY
jgi:hypothetical protein